MGSTLLLPVLLATSFWSCGDAQAVPVQTPVLQGKVTGSSASMYCRLSNEHVVHWYQHLPGKPPKRILYMWRQTATFDDNSDRRRFQAQKHSTEPLYYLTIDNLTPRDSGTYYCTYCIIRPWDADVKVFGSGTKLIVSNKGSSPPENSEILQKTHENQITYVCLIEKFYPEVIRVTWTDEENKEITDNVVKGDTWKPAEGDEYSVGSWLTVPVENKHKNYYCKYEHESQQHSLMTRDSKKNALQDEDCSTHPGNGTVFNRDHLFHRTAYLVYIALLLKSSMYYIIVLLFMYRMWAPTKQQGKKA
ncbi:immunoglobulin kappa light chain isoform X8 [Falco cherrug]|uniref:immunoglobulin kappa light chain isoform X8 n=1 Tax=Falco cherrug TaxID=345164 RepID=UPI00247ABCB4|nr:immunoglobulin kappa light chain isoform X8 [Falco cherrug]